MGWGVGTGMTTGTGMSEGVGWGADSGRGCPDFDPKIQSACGQYNDRFPDYFMNEEWWGVLSVRKGCTAGDADRVNPRRASPAALLIIRARVLVVDRS